MNTKLIKLAEQRAAITAKAAGQRAALGRAFEPWRGALGTADQGVLALRFLAHNKFLIAGAAALVVALKPKWALGWLRKGWMAWRTALSVKRKLGG